MCYTEKHSTVTFTAHTSQDRPYPSSFSTPTFTSGPHCVQKVQNAVLAAYLLVPWMPLAEIHMHHACTHPLFEVFQKRVFVLNDLYQLQDNKINFTILIITLSNDLNFTNGHQHLQSKLISINYYIAVVVWWSYY